VPTPAEGAPARVAPVSVSLGIVRASCGTRALNGENEELWCALAVMCEVVNCFRGGGSCIADSPSPSPQARRVGAGDGGPASGGGLGM
jgi:hypothetical protein